jgi:hypothetical protein
MDVYAFGMKFLFIIPINTHTDSGAGSWDSIVGIATGYGLDN